MCSFQKHNTTVMDNVLIVALSIRPRYMESFVQNDNYVLVISRAWNNFLYICIHDTYCRGLNEKDISTLLDRELSLLTYYCLYMLMTSRYCKLIRQSKPD